MNVLEILETILNNSSLTLEAFEYGITSEDVKDAIYDVKSTKEMIDWMNENSNGSLCDYFNREV